MSYVSKGIASHTATHRHSLMAKLHRFVVGSTAMAVGVLAGLSSLPASSAVNIPQTPLSVGTPVPGNLVLTPSVEFPTINSRANLGDYSLSRSYIGYFDPRICYEYRYSAVETERYFKPVATTTDGRCSGSKQWSGNFLSWAATQTIDPFRLVLTGGYRVVDTPTKTWLEKARNTAGTGNFANLSLTNATIIADATPASFSSFNMRIASLGNKMYFTQNGSVSNPGAALIAYDPGTHALGNVVVDQNRVYEVSVRVEVCDPAFDTATFRGLCKRYSQAWKPQGLMQDYSDRLTYSVFGYVNDHDTQRDGAALRARQKFIGPNTYFPGSAPVANPLAEWDPVTGVMSDQTAVGGRNYRNPNPADATATFATIADSGVMNYLNKFGQMPTNRTPKAYDPVSEMYYAALRYLKNQGNVPEYTSMTGDIYTLADGFPVITTWDDPIRYSCQTSVILGIGDTNTWNDKNLPGSTFLSGEPTRPSAVTADTTVNVMTRMQQIFNMEGFGTLTTPFQGRENSAFMAALAYDAHTRDIRPDLTGKQTVATHWVDVVEFGDLKGRRTNQYWLTGKYGGFTVPVGFDPDTNGSTPIPQGLWHTTNEYLTGGTTYPRADNFYVASEADKMVNSLRRAFQSIIQSVTSSGSSLSANSTVLDTGTKIYQAQYNPSSWSGELVSFNVNRTTGALTEAWRASARFPAWASRNIYSNSGDRYRLFRYTNLSSADATALGSQEVVNYLRGERVNETPAAMALRARDGILGDIVHSQPIFVGAPPNARLYAGKSFAGANSYETFATSTATLNRRKMVYVGANDGMLHGFDADTGDEMYAFVPSAVIPGLRDYTETDYIHRFSVDGEITVADAYLGVSKGWRTILVGTTGRGGRSIFALDITDPDPADIELLWEKDASDVPALGNVIGKPIIAQVANGDWRVLIGNGPNGSGDKAQLIMFDVENGDETVVDTGAGTDNGMFGVNAWSTGVTEFVDTAYAGDLRGNLWKITDLDGTPTVTLLFNANTGGVVRPITATPTVAVNPANAETWVMFGTGSYLTVADQTNRDLQQWFGLIDRGSAITNRTGLEEVNILEEAAASGELVRTIEPNSAPGADGWFVDLLKPGASATGERMVVPNIFRGGALIGVTRIPDSNADPCNPSGATGFIMAINPFTGGRLDKPAFDITGNGVFDSDDGINGTPASGFGLDAGTYSPLLIGDRYYLNDQNANITQGRFSFGSQPPTRVSWREIIRN
jgi:type IV pilus assembly protein PilY1